MTQESSLSTAAGSSALLVVTYWAIVAVPLGWGVYKTVQKSIPLFTGKSIVAAAPATPSVVPATPAPVLATPAALVTDPAATPMVSPTP